MHFDQTELTDLERYFRANEKRLIHKLSHYFEIYDRHFSRFRGKEIVMLEIGVSHGGSLQMWKSYFGPGVKIYGVDIDPACKNLEEEQIEIYIGSQADRKFLRKLRSEIPRIDILIDDGGHTMRQQIATYEELFPHISERGVYVCEDLHSSYWSEYGGGLRRKGSFIEYTKDFIDHLNAFHSREGHYKPNTFTRSVDSIHYYDSVIVIEKKPRKPPVWEKTGQQSEGIAYRNFGMKLRRRIREGANRVLGFFGLPGIH